jgi:hypothetical protein
MLLCVRKESSGSRSDEQRKKVSCGCDCFEVKKGRGHEAGRGDPARWDSTTTRAVPRNKSTISLARKLAKNDRVSALQMHAAQTLHPPRFDRVSKVPFSSCRHPGTPANQIDLRVSILERASNKFAFIWVIS